MNKKRQISFNFFVGYVHRYAFEIKTDSRKMVENILFQFEKGKEAAYSLSWGKGSFFNNVDKMRWVGGP